MGDDHRDWEGDMEPMMVSDAGGGVVSEAWAPARHRWTQEDVRVMVELGVIDAEDRLELVEGDLLQMSPKSEAHSWLTDFIAEELRGAYEREGFVKSQNPLAIAPDSLPEPDVAVIRGGHRDYVGRHPRGADCLLAVEVAVTSLEYDRHKTATYARGGVPVVWIIDVPGRRLEIYTDPRENGRYGRVTSVDESEEVDLPGLALRWTVASLLPPLA